MVRHLLLTLFFLGIDIDDLLPLYLTNDFTELEPVDFEQYFAIVRPVLIGEVDLVKVETLITQVTGDRLYLTSCAFANE